MGEFVPLHFKSFGEYKLPAQIYASIPGIYFFGLNELGVRITPVVYGTLTVLTFVLIVAATLQPTSYIPDRHVSSRNIPVAHTINKSFF